MARIVWLSVVAVLLLFACEHLCEARTDPQTGRIRLLHIGLAFLRPDHPDPVYLSDPKVDLTMVPAFEWVMTEEEIRRSLRMYMPRSKEDLDRNFDLVMIDGVDAAHIRTDFLEWVVDLVQNGQLSFVMTDSGSGWGFAGSGTSWYITPVERILTVDDQPGREGAVPSYASNAFKLVPLDPTHELMRNIPWDEIRFVAMNRPTERPGTRVVAQMSGERPVNREKPAIVYVDYPSGGRSVSYILTWHTMVHSPIVLSLYRWKWHVDALLNFVYWPCKVAIPEDLLLVHRVRESMWDIDVTRGYVLSAMEFADKIGANLQAIDRKLSVLDSKRRDCNGLYLRGEMEEAHRELAEVKAAYLDLVDEVLLARKKALLWIFAIEWLVVTPTFVISGVALWSMMIRRRAYREVKATRIRREDGMW